MRCGVLVVGDPLEAGPARTRRSRPGTASSTWVPRSPRCVPAPGLGGIDAVAVSSRRDADARRAADARPRRRRRVADRPAPPRPAAPRRGAACRPRPGRGGAARGTGRATPRRAHRHRACGVRLGRRGPACATGRGTPASWWGCASRVRTRSDGLTRVLAPLAPLGLSDRSVVSEAVVLRAASAVVADSPAGRADARAAGHPLWCTAPGTPSRPCSQELSTARDRRLARRGRPGPDDEVRARRRGRPPVRAPRAACASWSGCEVSRAR